MQPSELHSNRIGDAMFKMEHDSEEDFGDPERTRTSDPEFRKLVLYPAELRDRCTHIIACGLGCKMSRGTFAFHLRFKRILITVAISNGCERPMS
jgi:hypothetical protein